MSVTPNQDRRPPVKEAKMRLLSLVPAAFVLFTGLGPQQTATAADIRLLQPSLDSVPSSLLGADTAELAHQIAQALRKETGFSNLRNFSVYWERPSFQCLVHSYELAPDVESGVCLVEAGAFQVQATALLIKRRGSVEVSILDLLVE
ncbi:MAG TPA: hypothetical protein VKY54_09495 [Kiloniellales bacterium]|jgi:hypothetical protein|nr:hypothetical protein [Kiloniellales bacterium]